MRDITKRLRTEPCIDQGCHGIGSEGADEIDRLRAELDHAVRRAELLHDSLSTETARADEFTGAYCELRAGIALCLYFGLLGKEQIRVAVLDAPMLRDALAFVAPDGTPDQDDDAVVLAGDWGHSGRGVYCYLADYPEEGSIKLTGDGYEAKAKESAP